MAQVPVLDNGFVDLINVAASDLVVANAARVSLAARSESFSERDEKLIDQLMRERHTVPFEHTMFTFHVKAPLFVIQQWLKHRISSISQQSGRYSKLSESFYVPGYVRSQVGKSMSYKYEAMDEHTAQDVRDIVNVHNQMSYQMYEDLMEAGVAKEQARIVIPPTMYSELWFTVNAHSLMNFLRLRNDEHAQWEIQQYAQAMERLFAEQMPVTYAAWVKYGKPELKQPEES